MSEDPLKGPRRQFLGGSQFKFFSRWQNAATAIAIEKYVDQGDLEGAEGLSVKSKTTKKKSTSKKTVAKKTTKKRSTSTMRFTR